MHEDNAGGILAAATGGGILTFALAPLTLPIIGLTIAFTLPLLLIGVVASIPVAIVAGVFFAIARAVRAVRERSKESPSPRPRPGHRPQRLQRHRLHPVSGGAPDTRE
jgi:hypothetical protein